MDAMKIIKRAWYILWNYRALWIFGFILALTIGGSTYGRMGSNSGYHYNQNNNIQTSYPIPWDNQTFQDPQKLLEAVGKVGTQLVENVISQHEVGVLIGFAVAFILLTMLISIGLTILRYISETAVIRMVDEYETSGDKLTVKQGIRLGWSRISWRLFLIDLLIGFVPGLVMLVLLGLAGWGMFSLAINIGSNASLIPVLAVLAGFVFLIMLVFGLYFVLMGFLRNFIVRVCALDQVGVREAVQRGFSIVRRKWQEVGLFWLVMIGLGIAWWIASFVLLILLIPFFVVSIILAALVAGVPGLLVGGFSSIFLSGPWPIVVGIMFGLPVFIPLAVSPFLFFEGLAHIFRSITWTLVYRELKAMEHELIAAGEPVSAEQSA